MRLVAVWMVAVLSLPAVAAKPDVAVPTETTSPVVVAQPDASAAAQTTTAPFVYPRKTVIDFDDDSVISVHLADDGCPGCCFYPRSVARRSIMPHASKFMPGMRGWVLASAWEL